MTSSAVCADTYNWSESLSVLSKDLKMKAVVCEEIGPLRRLRLTEWAAPPIQPGAVRVRVKLASINPPDVFMPQGKYHVRPPLPFIPGVEAMGHVLEIGEGVTRLRVGDRVMVYPGSGCFAEEVVVQESRAVKVPNGMPDEVAAGFMLVYNTAYHALIDCGGLGRNESLIVLGASGGIGLAAVQIGKANGAQVIAVAGSDDKLSICREQGADCLINRNDADFLQALRAATHDRGADVALDIIGGEMTDVVMRAVRPYGRYLLAGAAKGELPLIKGSLVVLKQLQLIGVSYRLMLERTPSRAAENAETLCALWSNGKLRPKVGASFGLSDIVDALELVGAGKALGKVVVHIH